MKGNRMWNRGFVAAMTAAVMFGSSVLTGVASTSIVVGLVNEKGNKAGMQTESESPAGIEPETELETEPWSEADMITPAEMEAGTEESVGAGETAGTETEPWSEAGMITPAETEAGTEESVGVGETAGTEESIGAGETAGTEADMMTPAETEADTDELTGTEPESEMPTAAETELSTEEMAEPESEMDTEVQTEEQPAEEFHYEDTEVLVTVTALGDVQLPENTEVRVEKLTMGAEFEEAKAASVENTGISEDAVYTVYHVALMADGEELDIPDDMVSIQFQLREIPTEIEEPTILQIDDTDSGKVVQDITDQAIGAATVTE